MNETAEPRTAVLWNWLATHTRAVSENGIRCTGLVKKDQKDLKTVTKTASLLPPSFGIIQ